MARFRGHGTILIMFSFSEGYRIYQTILNETRWNSAPETKDANQISLKCTIKEASVYLVKTLPDAAVC